MRPHVSRATQGAGGGVRAPPLLPPERGGAGAVQVSSNDTRGRGSGAGAGAGEQGREQIAKKSGRGNQNETPPSNSMSVSQSGQHTSDAIEPKTDTHLIKMGTFPTQAGKCMQQFG